MVGKLVQDSCRISTKSFKGEKMKGLTKRALFIVLLGAFLILVIPLTGIADKQAQIQIGTYNLEFFTDLNSSTGPWCEEHNHRTLPQIKALALFIDSLDIEVLALQEVENAAALDLLLKYMPAGKYGYIISKQQGLCQRVAVLYQPKKVSLTYKGEIPLNLGHAGLRNGLVVYGKVLPDGFDFTLVVIHLKAHFDSKSTATREQQLKLLGNWVSDYLKNKGNGPDLILVGDFNEHLLTNKRNFSLLDQDLGLKDLLQDTPDKTCTPDGRYYSDPIDHIIISPNAENEYTGTTTLDNYFSDSTLSYRESYSDHCILWSDFSTLDLDGPSPSGSQASCQVSVTVESIDLVYNNHVGNEWLFSVAVNGQYVPVSSYSPTLVYESLVTGPTCLQITAKAVEYDKYSDVGTTTTTVQVDCPSESSRSQEVIMEVLVREDRGRYVGNTALWRFRIQIEII